MKAKELAEILLKNPDNEVFISICESRMFSAEIHSVSVYKGKSNIKYYSNPPNNSTSALYLNLYRP